jgi:predicted ATP-dependent protease
MSNRTSVKDMARALHERIKQYGVKAVFDQLDPDFKANEEKTLEGMKTKEKTKSNLKALRKAMNGFY